MRPRRSGSASCPASPALRAARQGQAPARTAGFPAIPASPGCPRMVPVSNGECISTACASVAQEPAGIHIEFFLHPHVAHRKRAVIRTLRRLSTALCTNHPQVTRGKLAHTIVRPFQAITCCRPGPGAQWWGLPPGSGSGPAGRRGPSLRGRSELRRGAGPARRARSARRGPGGGGRSGRRPGVAGARHRDAAGARARNAAVNTIALSRETTYHRYMTTRQAQKRDGHMNPVSQLEAALIGGVVAV